MNTTLTPTQRLRSRTGLNIIIRQPSLVLLVLMLVLVVVSGLIQWERYSAFRNQQLELLKESVNSAAIEINDDVWKYYDDLKSFVQVHKVLFTDLIRQPNDEQLYRQLDNALREKIRDMIGFTILTPDGQPRVRDFYSFLQTTSGITDNLTENSRVGLFALQPEGSYFGMMVTGDENNNVLFVGLNPDLVARTLGKNQRAGHRLVVLRRDTEGMIEVTTEGPRAKFERQPYLNADELSRIIARVPVGGTLWDIAGLPEEDLFSVELKRLFWEFLMIMVGLTMIVLMALWFINRETLQRQVAMRSWQQSEERFSQLAQHLHQVFWMYGADGLLYVSPAYENVWQRHRQQLYDNKISWLDTIHPEDRPRLEKAHGKEPVTAEFDEEYRIILPDGSIRWIWDRGFPIRNETGLIYRIAGIAEDITERKRAAEALRESEASYKSVVEDQTELICRFLPGGALSFVNNAYCRYFGKTSRELIGRNFLQFIPEVDRAAIERQIRSLNRNHPMTNYEHRVFAPDGTVSWLHWGTRILFDEAGEAIGYQSVGRDITERKQMEEELHKAHIELEARVEERTAELQTEITERKSAEEKMRSYAAQVERSNRELKDFAYVCSHDLQEPLRKIQAFGDRLKTKYDQDLPERGRDYLERMQSAAARMQKLISDLLVLSRVENKALSPGVVDLHEIARQTVSDLEVKIEETKGSVTIEPLPTIEADPMQMRQLFQNLIGNALKFHRDDAPPEVRIYGQSIDDGERYQFYVQDNGIGFEERYLDKIFTAFQRLHGRDTYEGTGIGLSICHRIVGRHGGSITAKSKPDEGTTFIVSLPVKQSAKAKSPDQASA